MDPRTLSDLLKDVPSSGDDGLASVVAGVAYRSGDVQPGEAFFCVPGLVHDGHDFALAAVARGAAVLVVERPVEGADVPQVVVEDARAALAWASARWYGTPSERMSVVGITGTNGKTTTAYLVDAIARAAGRRTGLLGTVETRIADGREPAVRTTPESADLQRLLARMADAGVETVAMEVSSHALDLHRVDGVSFAVAAFTNLSQDHLDYHGSMGAYLAAKSRLFTEMDVASRVVNIDDETGDRIAGGGNVEWVVGLSARANVRALDVSSGAAASSFRLRTPGGEAAVLLPMPGAFNVSNALVAAGCGLALGIGVDLVAEGLSRAPQVPGRLERIDEGQPFGVFVDYAHTPDGLAKAVAALRDVTPRRVVTVFGCGGDRDAMKRPLMGEAAGSLSDVVVVTSDNPRTEDPDEIIAQILPGLARTGAEVVVERDRRAAVRAALELACEGDTVLIAGKGHEDYQLFADRTIHFDDRQVAREELRSLLADRGARC